VYGAGDASDVDRFAVEDFFTARNLFAFRSRIS
jgi:hypothetical protein